MEFERLKDGGWRVFMTPEERQITIECAPHRRCRIAIMLMSLSLRRTVTTEVMPADFFKKDGLYWVGVEGKDPKSGYNQTLSRKVWVPDPIMNEIQSFIEARDIADNEPLIDVGPRQLNNWIDTATENAATRTETEEYTRITCHDYRRYFATHFLLRLRLDKQLVRQLGGWERVEHMTEYLLIPTGLLKRRLAEGGVLGTNPLALSGDKTADTIKANMDTTRKLLEQSSDPDVVETLVEEVQGVAEDVPEMQVTWLHESAVESRRDENKEEEEAGFQSSLNV